MLSKRTYAGNDNGSALLGTAGTPQAGHGRTCQPSTPGSWTSVSSWPS